MSLKMAPSGDRGTPPLGGTAGIERAYPSALAFRLNRAGAHSRKIGVESQDVSATSFVVGTTCGATEWVDGGAYNQRDVRVLVLRRSGNWQSCRIRFWRKWTPSSP